MLHPKAPHDETSYSFTFALPFFCLPLWPLLVLSHLRRPLPPETTGFCKRSITGLRELGAAAKCSQDAGYTAQPKNLTFAEPWTGTRLEYVFLEIWNTTTCANIEREENCEL